MVVHAGRLALLGVLGHRQRGHGDDRQLVETLAARRSCAGQRADPARRLQPIHHRHLDVHQHRVVIPLLHLVDGNLAIVRLVDLDAFAAQQFGGEFAVDVVVLDQQQARAGQLAAAWRARACRCDACPSSPRMRPRPSTERMVSSMVEGDTGLIRKPSTPACSASRTTSSRP